MKIHCNSEFEITSFKKFVEIIEQRHSATVSMQKKWIFRGHDCHSFKLIPGVGRFIEQNPLIPPATLYEMEKYALKQFQINTYKELQGINEFMLLAVAQHHGMKTRLLDWTFSPLTALFFAVQEESSWNLDGAFFAFYREKPITSILNASGSPFQVPGAEYQYIVTPGFSTRITAQDGLFQLFKHPEKPLDNQEGLEKYIIPKQCKKEIKTDLHNFGINYRTLFPDLDGIAKYINYSYYNHLLQIP